VNIRTALVALLASFVLLAVPAQAVAQETAPAPAAAAQPAPQEPIFTAASPAETATGLPRTGVDRTMRGYWHLFIAFAVTWLLLFGYAISLGRRFSALERKLERQG
jgi:CcmD family protein